MAYERQNFENGQTLTAQMMNKIEDGIVQLDKKINSQKRKNLLVLGDSMFGSTDGQYFLKKFCDEHNLELKNWAVSGSTFGYCGENSEGNKISPDILTTWKTNTTQEEGNEENFIPDLILIDGGGNDYRKAEYLFTEATNNNGEPIGIYNRAEKVFREISERFPFAKKFFLIIHRVSELTADYLASGNEVHIKPWDSKEVLLANGETITFPQISNELKNISNKYGFKCIDVYNNSFLTGVYEKDIKLLPVWYVNAKKENVVDTNYCSRILAFQRSNGIPLLNHQSFSMSYEKLITRTLINLDFLEWEGIHPRNLGYEIGYRPNLESAFNLINNTEKNFFDIKYFYQTTTDDDIITTTEINADNINSNDFTLFLCNFTDSNEQSNSEEIYVSNIGFYPTGNEGANTHSKIYEGTNFKGYLYYTAPGGLTINDKPTSIPEKADFIAGLKRCIEIEMDDEPIFSAEKQDNTIVYEEEQDGANHIRVKIDIKNVTGNINIIFKNNTTT